MVHRVGASRRSRRPNVLVGAIHVVSRGMWLSSTSTGQIRRKRTLGSGQPARCVCVLAQGKSIDLKRVDHGRLITVEWPRGYGLGC